MPELKRTLGLVECTLMGVGVILGAGIYALVGKAAGLGGNVVWVSFIGAAVVAAFTGLSYAELASFIPRAGGEYHYVRRAFGGLAAFLMSWMLLAGLGIASAAVALGFGGYFSAVVGGPPAISAIGVVVFSVGLLLYGIRESALFAMACTVLEVLGLVAVIAVGLPHLGSVDLLEPGPQGAAGVTAAAALIFFAYIGFEEIVQLGEETRDPGRILPLALVLSITISTVLYVLVALSAVSVVGWERLGASDAPLREVFAGVGWRTEEAISGIALFSTANTVLVILLSASRLLYGMAEDQVLPGFLARVSLTRQTPWVATLMVGALAIAVAASVSDIEVAAQLTNLSIFTTFLIINAAVIALRFREPDAPRPFRLPGAVLGIPVIPLAGMATVTVMMTQVPWSALGWGGLVFAGGVAAWLVRPRQVRPD